MDFFAIIKRSWQITWRYKALWILGVFAGVSGCTGGSTSSGGSNPFSEQGGGGFESMPSMPDLTSYIPVAIAAGILLILLGFVMWVLAVAARGGLVTGVNDYEETRQRRMGELWSAGFSRFGSLFDIELLLRLPLAIVGIGMFIAVFIALVMPLTSSGDMPGVAALAPLCGSLAIGVPVLLIGSFILGMMHLVALRYVMLGGQGAMQAAGNSWRFIRARLKDTVIMWFLNFALNMAASFVVAIPAFIVGIVIAFPIIAAVSSGNLSALWGIVPPLLLLIIFTTIVYNGIWGTFTSSLWTLFFRRVAGMHTQEIAQVPAPGPAPTPPVMAPEGPPMAVGEPPVALDE